MLGFWVGSLLWLVLASITNHTQKYKKKNVKKTQEPKTRTEEIAKAERDFNPL